MDDISINYTEIAKELGITAQEASLIIDILRRKGYYLVDPNKLSAQTRYEITGIKGE